MRNDQHFLHLNDRIGAYKDGPAQVVEHLPRPNPIPRLSRRWAAMQSTEKCPAPYCNRSILAKGLCNKHYTRMRNHGTLGPVKTSSDPWLPGHEGRYSVSTSGVVTSYVGITARVLKWKYDKDGYPRVPIGRGKGNPDCLLVHRLVLMSHVGPCPEGMVARHLDGNPGNPEVENLAWGTQSENLHDKKRHGTDHNLNKTHCPHGHPYDSANTYVRRDRPAGRDCRACGRAATARYLARKKAEVAP